MKRMDMKEIFIIEEVKKTVDNVATPEEKERGRCIEDAESKKQILVA